MTIPTSRLNPRSSVGLCRVNQLDYKFTNYPRRHPPRVRLIQYGPNERLLDVVIVTLPFSFIFRQALKSSHRACKSFSGKVLHAEYQIKMPPLRFVLSFACFCAPFAPANSVLHLPDVIVSCDTQNNSVVWWFPSF